MVRALGAAAALLLLASLAPVSARGAAAPLVFRKPDRTRADIERALLARGERWAIVYGTHGPGAGTLKARASALARRMVGDSAAAVADTSAATDLVAARSVVLIGGPASNSWTARLAAALPVRFTARGFAWQEREYAAPDEAIELVYAHPLDPARLVVLVAANSPAATAQSLALGGRGDWRILRAGEVVRSGAFAPRAGEPWRYDPALDRDRERERERFARALVRRAGPGVKLETPPAFPASSAALGAAEARAAEVRRLGVGAPAGTRAGATDVVVRLYTSLAEKAAMTGVTRPEHVDDDGVAHAVLPPGRDAWDLWSVPSAALVRAGASRDSRFLVPAGVWIAGRYGGEPLARAVARIYDGRLLPVPAEAATTDTLWRSPLIWVPARALLARSVFEAAGARGPAALRTLLARDPPAELAALCRGAGVDPARVSARYLELADSLARAARRTPVARAPRKWQAADGFQRGVCFAHAAGEERGYLSQAADRELTALQQMGADWIALAPPGYLTALDPPRLEPSAQGGAGDATDEAVCEAAARARARGLRVWLSPQISAPGWEGELRFSASRWRRFFEQYRRFALHHALLAEREGIDGLVVGHELASATAADPERWRTLIADVRRVYGGTLAYAADALQEAQRLPFWDALDAIGVTLHAPLAEQPTRDPKAIEAGVRRALDGLRAIGERHALPVVLFEAGSPATTAAAARPWEDTGDPLDLEAQRACYEALVRAIDEPTWLGGVFFWKWDSDGGGGPTDVSPTPRGKPAQEILSRALRSWSGRPVRAATAAPRR